LFLSRKQFKLTVREAQEELIVCEAHAELSLHLIKNLNLKIQRKILPAPFQEAKEGKHNQPLHQRKLPRA